MFHLHQLFYFWRDGRNTIDTFWKWKYLPCGSSCFLMNIQLKFSLIVEALWETLLTYKSGHMPHLWSTSFIGHYFIILEYHYSLWQSAHALNTLPLSKPCHSLGSSLVPCEEKRPTVSSDHWHVLGIWSMCSEPCNTTLPFRSCWGLNPGSSAYSLNILPLKNRTNLLIFTSKYKGNGKAHKDRQRCTYKLF